MLSYTTGAVPASHSTTLQDPVFDRSAGSDNHAPSPKDDDGTCHPRQTHGSTSSGYYRTLSDEASRSPHVEAEEVSHMSVCRPMPDTEGTYQLFADDPEETAET